MKNLVAVLACTLLAVPALAGPIEEAAKLKKAGKKPEALALLEKASEAAPKDCPLLKVLGDTYFEVDDLDLGAMTYERYVKDCPNDPGSAEVSKKLAAHYDSKMAAEGPPAAAAGGQGGIYLVPLPPARIMGAGTEDDRWAVEDFSSRTERMNPVEQACEQLRTNRVKEAVATLEAQVKKKPGDDQAWRYLGTARAMNGDVPGAVKAYEKYLSLEPKAPDADPIRKSVQYHKKKK